MNANTDGRTVAKMSKQRRVFEAETSIWGGDLWTLWEMNVDGFPRGLIRAGGYIFHGLYFGRKIGCRSNYSRTGYESVEAFAHYHFGKRIEIRYRERWEPAA